MICFHWLVLYVMKFPETRFDLMIYWHSFIMHVTKFGRHELISWFASIVCCCMWWNSQRHDLIWWFTVILSKCMWQNSVDTNWSRDLLPLFGIVCEEIPRDTNWSDDLLALIYNASDNILYTWIDLVICFHCLVLYVIKFPETRFDLMIYCHSFTMHVTKIR